jgi:hypothetical protein
MLGWLDVLTLRTQASLDATLLEFIPPNMKTVDELSACMQGAKRGPGANKVGCINRHELLLSMDMTQSSPFTPRASLPPNTTKREDPRQTHAEFLRGLGWSPKEGESTRQLLFAPSDSDQTSFNKPPPTLAPPKKRARDSSLEAHVAPQ